MKRAIIAIGVAMSLVAPIVAQAAKTNERGYMNVSWSCKYAGDLAALLGATIKTSSIGSGVVNVDVTYCGLSANQIKEGTTPFNPDFINPCVDGLDAYGVAILENTKPGTEINLTEINLCN